MKINYSNILYSPVKEQDFIWVASYMDGSKLVEISPDTKKTNSFYSIDKSKLIRFGLAGHGMETYFEVYGGEYKIAGRLVELMYLDRKTNTEYLLTGHGLLPYNNIDQFKNADSSLDAFKGHGYSGSTITQYNFGYTKNITVNEVDFALKTLCCIPYGKSIYLDIELSANRDFEHGMLLIRLNRTQVFELDAPLEKGQASSGRWTII